MEPTIHINASDGTDFYQQIATFAYGSYVPPGCGFTALVTVQPTSSISSRIMRQ